MRRYDYPQSFATGVIAAGGTLGAMFPPSTVLAVYGIITAAGHRQAVHRRHPARPARGRRMYMLTIAVIGRVRPGFLPAGVAAPWTPSA